MNIFLYSKNHLLITHWQESLKQHQLTVEPDFAQLSARLENLKPSPVLLYDFYLPEKQMQEHINALKNISIPIILDCQANFKRGKTALSAGALGYGNALMHAVHLLSAITAVQEGKVWLYPDFISELILQVNEDKDTPIEQNPRLDKLSEREREVAILVKQGLNNKEIADRLEITIRTVKAHTGKIYKKLGVKDRLGLVVLL